MNAEYRSQKGHRARARTHSGLNDDEKELGRAASASARACGKMRAGTLFSVCRFARSFAKVRKEPGVVDADGEYRLRALTSTSNREEGEGEGSWRSADRTFASAPYASAVCSWPSCRGTCCSPAPVPLVCGKSPAARPRGRLAPPS